MMVIENDEKIILEYGRTIVNINGVEKMLKHFLAWSLSKQNNTTVTEEFKKLDTKEFGPLLGVFRDKILKIFPIAQSLYDDINLLNNDRIGLVHVSTAEIGTLDQGQNWVGKGEYALSSYKRRDGTVIPEQLLTVETLKNITKRAQLIIETISSLMLSNFNSDIPSDTVL